MLKETGPSWFDKLTIRVLGCARKASEFFR